MLCIPLAAVSINGLRLNPEEPIEYLSKNFLCKPQLHLVRAQCTHYTGCPKKKCNELHFPRLQGK